MRSQQPNGHHPAIVKIMRDLQQSVNGLNLPGLSIVLRIEYGYKGSCAVHLSNEASPTMAALANITTHGVDKFLEDITGHKMQVEARAVPASEIGGKKYHIEVERSGGSNAN